MEKNEEKFNFKKNLLAILHIMQELEDGVRSINEDQKVTKKIHETLQQYVVSFIINFRNLESELEKERRQKTTWKYISLTLAFVCGIIFIIIFFTLLLIYAAR